jgi:tetratricopeptide (TPR) repeat protein
MRRLAHATAGIVAAFAAIGGVEALEPSQSATVMGPTNPQLSEGSIALQEGRVEEGIRLTLDGLMQPTGLHDKAAGYSNLCAGYALLKQWEDALKHCNTAVELDKNNWRAFNNRAAVHAGRGHYELAMSDIRSGLEIAPNSRTLHESLRIIQQNKRLLSARSRSSVRAP